MTKRRLVSWRVRVAHILLCYVGVGLLISLAQNLLGLFSGNLSAFLWTGTIKGNGTLMFWWALMPALTWPQDVWWTVYHKVLH
jgi:hypothetical protein